MTEVDRDDNGYKKGCGFRFHLDDVCKFNSDQCNSTDCDMFDIEWDAVSVKLQIEKERKRLQDVIDKIKDMKDKSIDKDNKKEFKSLKAKKVDLTFGLLYLGEAYDYLLGGKYSKLASRFPRLAKKFKLKAMEDESNEHGQEEESEY